MGRNEPSWPVNTSPMAMRAFGQCSWLMLGVVVCGWILHSGYPRRPAPATNATPFHHPERCQAEAANRIRVATFNIRGGRGTDERHDLNRTARSLAGVDLAALQEVRGSFGFGFGRDQAAILADELGMASVFVPTEHRWWHGNVGNGFLTRLRLEGMHRIPLTGTQDRRFRAAVLTTLKLQKQTVHVLMVHNDDRQDHDVQFATIAQLFFALKAPAILVGDLNTLESTPEMKWLLSHPEITGVVSERWPDREPLRGVDWIITRGLRVVRSECRDLGASDHPVLWAELELIPNWAARRRSNVE